VTGGLSAASTASGQVQGRRLSSGKTWKHLAKHVLRHTTCGRALFAVGSNPEAAACSARDPFYPPELAQWIAATAPDGRIELFHDSGHATAWDEPARFAQVIREFAGLG
jgi:pimeloyl-ACP methyl ester carboxylesterase